MTIPTLPRSILDWVRSRIAEEFAGPDWDEGYRQGYEDGKVAGRAAQDPRGTFDDGYREGIRDVARYQQAYREALHDEAN